MKKRDPGSDTIKVVYIRAARHTKTQRAFPSISNTLNCNGGLFRSLPQEIQLPQGGLWRFRRFNLLHRDLDEFADRDLGERDDLGLVPDLEAEIQRQHDGDIQVGADEGLGGPT